jgi:hypothetical protein
MIGKIATNPSCLRVFVVNESARAEDFGPRCFIRNME